MRHAILVAGIVGTFLVATPVYAGSGPITADDRAEANSDTIQIYVLDNDTDPDDDLDLDSLALVAEPSKGKATVISTGKPRVKYSQQPGETGKDHFTYRVCDTTNLCATATVTITIISATPASTSTTIAATATTLAPTTTTPASTTTTTDAATTEGSTPPSSSTTTAPTHTIQTAATTPPRIDAVGQAVLSSPTTNKAVLGKGQSVAMAATVAMIAEAGVETIRIAAVPAILGAGIAGLLAGGLPQDALAAFLGWFAGRHQREETETPPDPDTGNG
jgi:hypothetical protein